MLGITVGVLASKARFSVILGAVALAGGTAFLSVMSASPAAASPTIAKGTGEGPGFCASVVSQGQPLGSGATSFDDVYPCGPEPGSSFPPYGDAFQPSGGFQCTELANRFLFDVWNIAPVFGSSLDGSNFARTVHMDHPSVELVANGTPGEPYLPGDIVSFTGNSKEPDGHVAAVTASTENASGNGTITIMEQNAAASGSETLTVSGWSLKPAPGSWVTPSDFLALATTTQTPNTDTGPAVVARTSTSMDVFYRTAGGQLAEDFWSAAGGWGNQTLAGPANVATGPAVVARTSTSMDVFYRTAGGQLAEDFWSAAGGWGNQTP
jgi:CHAP domain